MSPHDASIRAPAGASSNLTPTGSFIDRNQLRREMRARRRAVSDTEQQRAGESIARILDRQRLLRPGRRLGVYISHGREADLGTAIALARQRDCHLYLPAITQLRHSRMDFLSFDSGTSLRLNMFGIPEPDPRQAERIAVRQLDLILVPLVAVDPWGSRLGSGAGFYDRRLRHRKTHLRWQRPRLIGIAYEFQRVAHLPTQPWDVPLDAVITERRFYPRLPT